MISGLIRESLFDILKKKKFKMNLRNLNVRVSSGYQMNVKAEMMQELVGSLGGTGDPR